MEEIRRKKKTYSLEVLEKKRRIALENLKKARANFKAGYKWKSTLLKENIEKDLRDNLITAILPYFPDITYQMIYQALGGDGKMMQYIMNQMVGRAKETVEQTGSAEGLKEIETSVRELLNRKDV